MKRFPIGLAALAALALAFPAHAQAPGGRQMSPEIQARMKAWQKWRDTHKNVASLQQTLAGFTEMEKEPKTQLTKAQAKTVVGVLKAWRNKPAMTDAQALKVNKQITAPLTVAQLKKIATAPRFGGGRRGQGGGQGGMRPGGPGGPGGPGAGAPRPNGQRPGGQRRFDISRFPAPKDYNPLNPNTLPFERQRPRAKQMLDTLTQRLSARATGK